MNALAALQEGFASGGVVDQPLENDNIPVRLSDGERFCPITKMWCADCKGIPCNVTYPDQCHASHTIRDSDASSFDFICTNCGATDVSGGGWGRLRFTCTGGPNRKASK